MKALPACAFVAALCLLAALAGCGEKPPIVLGFVGGLTGRTADLGTSGRNGIEMAVEQLNAAGGIRGRRVDLLIKDDQSDAQVGRQVVRELLDAKVQAILGPMTSVVATAVAPLATQANVLMMAGPVTTDELSARDDQFFRPIAANDHHAEVMAKYLFEKRGLRRVNAAVNLSNSSYTESWIGNFDRFFTALGGKVEHVVRYASTQDADFTKLSSELLVASPQAVILVTNAVDAALFANQLRKSATSALVVTSEWAGTGKLIELGAGNVEGVVVPQYLNLQDQDAHFLAVRDRYRERFKQDIGFPAVVSYDGAQIVFKALAEQRDGESLKQTLLRLRKFTGLQQTISFDDYGDVQSKTYLTLIKDGRYVTIE